MNSVIPQIAHYHIDSESGDPFLEGEEWVSVYTCGVEYEAELIKGRLLEEEIPATVLNQGDSMRPFTFGSLAVYKVMVPKEYAERAEALITENEKGA